ncbi:variable surface lipoprotein [Metamycoplasma alkalescens]|nr:variable surface lipoprotein [Metamycoplasma alkalescens]
MKKLNKILISLASIVSVSSLPLVAASCGGTKKPEAELIRPDQYKGKK